MIKADKPVYIVVAVDKENGIGKNRTLAWNLRKDLKHFQDVTTRTTDPAKQNMLVMGDITWESIPAAHRPFKGRKNVVMCLDPAYKAEGAEVVGSFEEAFALADDSIEKIFVIGGASIYRQSVEKVDLDGLYITRLDRAFGCDTFFPEVPPRYSKLQKLGSDEEDGIGFEYLLYLKG